MQYSEDEHILNLWKKSCPEILCAYVWFPSEMEVYFPVAPQTVEQMGRILVSEPVFLNNCYSDNENFAADSTCELQKCIFK